jgi:Ca2+-binding EF-hand superfamily protein
MSIKKEDHEPYRRSIFGLQVKVIEEKDQSDVNSFQESEDNIEVNSKDPRILKVNNFIGNESNVDKTRTQSFQGGSTMGPDIKARTNSVFNNDHRGSESITGGGMHLKNWVTSVVKPEPNKQAFRKSNFDEKIIPQTTENLIDKTNYDQKNSFDFQDRELLEIFDILDRGKKGYLNYGDIVYFLELFGIESNEEDVIEMIRMTDNQGTKKVYYDQFKLMAKGKLLSPIGIAFPPTLDVLDNKNLKPENMVKNQMDAIKNGPKKTDIQSKQLDLSENKADQPTAKEKAYENLVQTTNLNKINTKNQEQNRKEKIQNLSKLFRNEKFKFQDIFALIKGSKDINIENVPLETCDRILNFEKTEETKSLLAPFSKPSGKYVNFQEILINWITFQKWTDTNKAYMAFYVMDIHSSGTISFDQLHSMLSWIHLETLSDKREKILKQIFEIMKLNSSDPIEIRTLENIIHSYQGSLLDPVKLRIDENIEFTN